MVAKKAGRKIALVWVDPPDQDIPYDDPSWEIWTWNRPGLEQAKRFDRLFEIHRTWCYEDDPQGYLEALKKVKPPKQVVSIVPLADTPANVVIDREALFEKYGAVWFSSSIAYAFACALEEKPAEIGLWAIELEGVEEYAAQFPAALHFIAIAKERGIKVTMSEYCALRRQPSPYPDRFETTVALILEKKAKLIQRRLEKAASFLDEWRSCLYRLQGEYQHRFEDDRLMPLTRKDLKKEIEKASRQYSAAHSRVEQLKGQLAATQHYRRMFVWDVLPPSIGDAIDPVIENTGPI